MNLDIRDRDFWYQQATKKLAREQLKIIEAVKFPYMKQEEADRRLSQLRSVAYPEEYEAEKDQAKREAEWAANRKQLRAMLRGV